MALDPEARENSSSAMIIGVAALILIIGAVAYFATRPAPESQTIVVTPTSAPATNTVVREVPVPATNPETIVVAPPAPDVIERNTTTNTTTVVTRPTASVNVSNGSTPSGGAPNSAAGTRGTNNTNVTINVPPGSTGNTNRANSSPATTVTEAAPIDNATVAPTDAGY